MSDDNSSRFPRLGKLGLALLEHLVEPVIGKDARDVIKAPIVEKELRTALGQILVDTEDHFKTTYGDGELSTALIDLPLATLPSLQKAVWDFYNRPSDNALHQVLTTKLSETVPILAQERIEAAVDAYLTILKEELVAAVPTSEFRDKIGVLLLQSMKADTNQMQQILSQMLTLMKSWPHHDAETELMELQKYQPEQLQIQQIIAGLLELLTAWRHPALLEVTPIIQTLQHSDAAIVKRADTMNQYDRLRSWLNYLVDEEFRDLIRSILPQPEEQNLLPRQVEVCSRGEFLGHIQRRERLNELERYLLERYSDRLSN